MSIHPRSLIFYPTKELKYIIQSIKKSQYIRKKKVKANKSVKLMHGPKLFLYSTVFLVACWGKLPLWLGICSSCNLYSRWRSPNSQPQKKNLPHKVFKTLTMLCLNSRIGLESSINSLKNSYLYLQNGCVGSLAPSW